MNHFWFDFNFSCNIINFSSQMSTIFQSNETPEKCPNCMNHNFQEHETKETITLYFWVTSTLFCNGHMTDIYSSPQQQLPIWQILPTDSWVAKQEVSWKWNISQPTLSNDSRSDTVSDHQYIDADRLSRDKWFL